MKKAVLFAVLSLATMQVFATKYTWVGPTSGSATWSDSENWSPNTGYPSSSSDTANVNAADGGDELVFSGGPACKYLIVGSGVVRFDYSGNSD